MAKRNTSTDEHHHRTYVVDRERFRDFDPAAGRAVALAVQRREAVCIEAVVRGDVVERIDVTASLSID